MKNYSLASEPRKGDTLSNNIYNRRNKLYNNIIAFSKQNVNDGVAGENIVRLIFDGVNLNHLSKNHPHVDIAIINPIRNIVSRNEIISVKSSLKTNPSMATLMSDTKSIKLESLFSYMLFAVYHFNLNYESMDFKSKSSLNKAIETVHRGTNKDYRAAVNVTAYYLIFKNNNNEKANFDTDINKISNGDYLLTHGEYEDYAQGVGSKINNLDAPISLAGIYLDRDRENNPACIIKKTNTVPLNIYWNRLLDIWIDKKFFQFHETNKEGITTLRPKAKYLTMDLVKDLFKIERGDDFPVDIRISVDGYSPNYTDRSNLSDEEKIAIARTRGHKKTNKLYVATKFKDSEFGRKDDDVNRFFLKSIDMLEKNPRLILKFNNFIKVLENPPKLAKWTDQNTDWNPVLDIKK